MINLELDCGSYSLLSLTLHADDLVVIAETEDDLTKRPNEWKDNMENRDMRVNMNKMKVNDKLRTSEANAEGCKMAMWCLW